MTTLTTFLILGLGFMAFEIWIFFNTDAYSYFAKRTKEISDNLKNKEITSLSDVDPKDLSDLKEGLKLTVFGISYLVWCIAGLFTSMALFFLPIFGVMLLTYFGKKMFKSDKAQNIMTKMDALACVVIFIAMFSHHYTTLLGL